MQTTNLNNQSPFRRPESIDEIINNFTDHRNKARFEERISALSSIQTQMDKIKLDFYLIAESFRMNIPITNPLNPPFEIPKHRNLAKKYRFGEYGSYAASLIILTYLTFSYLDYEWWMNALIVLFFFTIITLIMPLLTEVFNVNKENPDSINRLKTAIYILTLLTLICTAIFALFRSSTETSGITVMLWDYSMPAAEIFTAFLASCCAEAKRFYGWSKELKDEYNQLDAQSKKIEAEIANISSKIPPNNSPNGGSSNNGSATDDLTKSVVVVPQTVSANGGTVANENIGK